MHVAPNAGSVGTVSAATAFINLATVNIGDQFNIARNDTGAAAGTATVTASTGSQFLVGGETRLGDTDGGTGTLRLNGGNVTTRSLIIDPTHGVLDHDNGVLSIDAGVLTVPAGFFAVNGGTSTDDPTLRFTNGATMVTPAFGP